MASTYLLINLAIIAVPLLLSFERRVFYFRKWPRVLSSILIVGSVYVFWDVWATLLGHWGFNPVHVSGVKIFGLPFEEVLFFGTAPFSCLFIYEVVSYFHRDKILRLNGMLLYGVVGLALALGSLAIEKSYTALSFFMFALFLFVAVKFFRPIVGTQNFWIYLGICYIPFTIFNGILTSLPVVTYDPAAITGLRAGTIPVEDFFYNFSLLGFTLLFYKLFDLPRTRS